MDTKLIDEFMEAAYLVGWMTANKSNDDEIAVQRGKMMLKRELLIDGLQHDKSNPKETNGSLVRYLRETIKDLEDTLAMVVHQSGGEIRINDFTVEQILGERESLKLTVFRDATSMGTVVKLEKRNGN